METQGSRRPHIASSGEALVAAARELAPQLRSMSAEIESSRRLPDSIVASLVRTGILRMWTPKAFGGGEVDPITCIRVVEELSRANGSVGWCTMIITGTAAYTNAFLEDEVAREVYGDPDVITCGFGTPLGKAVEVSGGYRVTARWPFGSASLHAHWLVSGVNVTRADGSTDWMNIVTPAKDVEIIDTWHTLGLRGTGSNDYVANELFVPKSRTFSLHRDPSRRPGPLYAFRGLFLANMSGVPLGVAQGALDLILERVANNQLRVSHQLDTFLAQAEGLIDSARCYMYDAVQDAWETLSDGKPLTLRQRARFRSALTNSNVASVKAVELLYTAAGGSAVYNRNIIEQHFRDAYMISQHASFSGLSTNELIGRMLRGLEPDPALPRVL